MQMSSRLLFRTAIILLGVILCLGLLLSYGLNDREAKALSAGEWQTVAQALDDFVDSQYVATDDGEAGFLRPATTLKTQTDSNNDGTYLGEGDDAALAPVLVDVLGNRTDVIPATSFRLPTSWSTAADVANSTAVAGLVQNYRDAGFSTDLVIYCLTGHAQSPPTMAYGAMSAGGYFDDPATGAVETPRVEGFKFGRLGWGGSLGGSNYTRNLPYTPTALATPSSALPTSANCAGVTPAAELVRCAADAVMASTGAGQTPWAAASDAFYQPVDIRPGTPANYMADQSGSSNPYAYSNSFQNLFDATGGSYANLQAIDSSKTTVFANRTEHTGLFAAQGLNMLGGNAKGLRFGLPEWNGQNPPNWPEKWSNPGYALQTVAAYGGVDTTAPTITVAPSVSNITDSSVDISRTTDEPATSKIEYEVAGSGVWTTANNTVLNSAKTSSLTGLAASTNYNYKLTAYDGNANASTTAMGSFTTAAPPCTPVKPTINISTRFAYWASPADYAARNLTVKLRVTNGGATSPADDAFNVDITAASNTNGVTLISAPHNLGSIAAGAWTEVDVVYNVPMGVTGFISSLTGNADDVCGTTWLMP
jgi:hypothetical protein